MIYLAHVLDHPATLATLALGMGLSGAPFQYFFLGIFVLLLITILRAKPTVQELIAAANSLGTNPMAIIVIVIGCIMLREANSAGDSNIASTIVGYGGGLLQAQIKDQLHPPGSVVNSTQETKVVTPPDPTLESDPNAPK